MKNDQSPKGSSLLKIFNYIGGTLIFIGISYFISDNWSSLSNFTKIFSTLGSAIAAYCMGMLLSTQRKYLAASSAFFMIAGLVLPVGLFVTFFIMDWNLQPVTQNLIVTGICLLAFLLTQLVMPRTVILLFTVIFASLFFIALTNYNIHFSHFVFTDLFIYQFFCIGLSYIFLGRYLDYHDNPLVGPLYFFGALFVLTSSFDLAGYLFFNEGLRLWKGLALGFLILSFLCSIPLKSKSLLYFGALFLLLYVANLTYEYESIFGSFGWPFILITAGLMLMLLGYLLYFIHQLINKS